MHVKEYQEVTLFFPEDYHLVKDFEADKDQKEVSISTVGATYIKCLKDVHFTAKGTDQSPCIGCPNVTLCQPCKEYLEWEEKHNG